MSFDLKGGSLEAVSKLRIIGNEKLPAPEARKPIARGKHSEPLVGYCIIKSPGRGERG
jgi:hypothetical protein